MRKVSIEVKTVYSIRFDFEDFAAIFCAAKKDNSRVNEFNNFNLDDTSTKNIRDCYKSLGTPTLFQGVEEGKQQTENIRYIVRKLGFDGVEHYGGFYNGREEYSMTVYNRGADI